MAYRLFMAIDLVALVILGCFFVSGLQYANSPAYLTIWLPVLGVPIAVLALAWKLRGQGRSGTAALLVGLLAIPPLLFVAFFGLLLLLNPDWH